MKVGISCAGIGSGATGHFIRRSAQAAERAGFSSFWLPDHVVLFDLYPHSKYAYGELFGDSPIPDPNTPLTDPIIGMTWAAAATSSIEVGTSILILPERNPVVLAKELASLDALSGGRLVLGVGVGWSREEYEAVGADWTKRGKRMDEYIAVMRTLWRDDVAQFHGETFSFEHVCLNPKPVRKDVPILIGGESEAALRRTARVGDGWFPYKLKVEDAAARIAYLKQITREQGRDPDAFRIAAPLFESSAIDDLKRFRDAGVTEFYLGIFPEQAMDDAQLDARIAELGERFVEPLASW